MIDERISAFLDGECDAEESEHAIARLVAGGEARAAWQRQLWIREALRSADGELPAHDPAFADRVSAALGADQQAARSKVVSLRSRRRWLAPAAGLAAAASVAAAVVLVSEPFSPAVAPPSAPASTLSASAEPASAPAGATRVSASTPSEASAGRAASGWQTVSVRRQQADHWSVSDPAVEEQLNGYLIEHNGLARSYGLSGATPSFVRVATYGRDGNR